MNKEKRNAGESYIREGIVRPARKILREPCADSCRIQCSSRFTNTEREQILKDFWELGNLPSQREYIVRHMAQIHSKYAKKGDQRKRSLNFSYNFDRDEELVKVCRTFFVNTLNIGDKMIRTSVQKFMKAEDGFIEAEQRGKRNTKK